MENVKGILKKFVLCGCAVVGLTGCAGVDNSEVDYSVMKPCAIYNRAVVDFNDKLYPSVNEQLISLEENYPFNDVMDEAIFLAGKSYFLNDKFMEATERFKKFLKLYPRDARVVEAEYMLVMSYWYMSGTIERDITFLGMAQREMKKFVKKYPDNANTLELNRKIASIQASLAKKQVDIAVYMMNDNDFAAAIARLQAVLVKYKDTVLLEEAMYRMVEAYGSLELWDEAQYYMAKLKADYPDSEWNKEADKWFGKAVEK